MRHIIHDDDYDTAILIKEAAFKKDQLVKHYIEPIGLKALSMTLDYGGNKKPSAACAKAYLAELLPVLKESDIKTILVCDGEYFKKLAGKQKTEAFYGYVLPVTIAGYTDMNVCLCPNYQTVYYNPRMAEKIELSLTALRTFQEGNYTAIGTDIIKEAHYPSDLAEIKAHLDRLMQVPELTCDIEAFSLRHYDAGIGTFSLAETQHKGIAFSVDYESCEPEEIKVWCNKDNKYKKRIAYGRKVDNPAKRALIKDFLLNYKGKLIYHGASYDVTVLIYVLFMDHILDQEGLLRGLELMNQNLEDTMLITYLATNSCAGNKLGLKEQAHEFAGNYAESDISDIRLIPEVKLLKYNLIDTLSTWYTYNKHINTLVTDEQEDVYLKFKEFLWEIIQMQLTGFCIDMPEVKKAKRKLQALASKSLARMEQLTTVKNFTERLRQERITADNAKLKNKKRLYSEVEHLTFNPGSGVQLQRLLYEDLNLPIVDYTKTKAPAVGGKTLKKLKNLTNDPEAVELLDSLVDYIGVRKILDSFIPALEKAQLGPDGEYYLFGSFKLGGTVSGRLSSSNPNMQNLPSGSIWAKVIKACFKAPKGWVMLGADSNALEDRVNTLLTRDPNKEKVLLDGFDGHSFRTYHFWPEKFPDLNPEDPVSINTIEVNHKKERSDSKPAHFAMQYLGTHSTLMVNCGFSKDEAIAIENNYKELYKVSFDWVDNITRQAAKVGYATVAFGLRIRCPVLAKSVLGSRVTTREASAELRTLGNAASGQSYNLLNSRSSNEFMNLVRNHEEYRYKVRIAAQIHDAQYYYVRDELDLILWVNDNLPRCMAWQDLPELAHEHITLPANVDIFYPTWKDEITLPNNINREELVTILSDVRTKRLEQ